MVTVADSDLAVRGRRLREHGMSSSAAERHAAGGVVIERYLETGFNWRMTDVQAAIGLVQLGRLEAIIARRRELAARYQTALADLPGIVTASDPPFGTTNYQSFWVLPADDGPISRNTLLDCLAEAGISARRGIMASHLEPAYAGVVSTPLPVTERITNDSLILPLYHDLSEVDQDRVIDVLVAELAGAARH